MAKRKSRKVAKRKNQMRRPGRKSAGKLPKNAVTLTVILRAREGQELLLEAELRALVGPSRREEGCFTFDLYRSADGPGAYLLHEVWASREHHRLHMQTRHFLRWSAGKDALLASREASFWTQVS
jgi:quinol monooxygenase YgiN